MIDFSTSVDVMQAAGRKIEEIMELIQHDYYK